MINKNITPIIVPLEQNRSYPIHIDNQALNQFSNYLAPLNIGKKIGLIYTESTQTYAEKIKASLPPQKYTLFQYKVIEGEAAKSWNNLKQLLDQLFEWNLERHDTLIAIGGGVIGDLTGFAASIYLRGITVIQVPTTLLSQVDAAIGGKTGINHPKGKNLIGAFHQPKMVIIDTNTLTTLPTREIRSGLAEIIKYGVIMNEPLFKLIETQQSTIATLTYQQKPELWDTLITHSCQNKATIVSEDEKESKQRMILNFGHTIGHAIEAVHDYHTYTHGECVALGMVAATHIAVQRQWLPQSEADRLTSLLSTLGFPQKISNQNPENYLNRMLHDKKIINGKIRFILPTQIGNVKCVEDVTKEEIINAISVIME